MSTGFVSKHIARRDFLRIGSQALMITAAGTLVNPKALFASSPGAAFDPLLSIGYAPGRPADGSSVALVTADRILSPDPLFISRGAQVSVLSSARIATQKNAPGSLYLDALFPSRSGAANENRRFRFWSMAGRPDHDALSGNMSFRVPVLATTGIAFTARYRRPDAGSPSDPTQLPPIEGDNTSFTLSLGNVPGPNLRSGIYVVALHEPNDQSSVAWNRFRVSNQGGLYAISGATFSYVILDVELAEEEKPTPRRRAA